MAGGAASLQQMARCVQIDLHAQVEIRLGLAADDGGQMKDRADIRLDEALQEGWIGDVALNSLDALVGRSVG